MDLIYWTLAGNKNTDRRDKFLGTIDNVLFIIQTNNTEVRKAIEGAHDGYPSIVGAARRRPGSPSVAARGAWYSP
jgi:hypothetical protein